MPECTVYHLLHQSVEIPQLWCLLPTYTGQETATCYQMFMKHVLFRTAKRTIPQKETHFPVSFARSHQSLRTISNPFSSCLVTYFPSPVGSTVRAAYFFFFNNSKDLKTPSISISNNLYSLFTSFLICECTNIKTKCNTLTVDKFNFHRIKFKTINITHHVFVDAF